jgi:hypothetical protein
MSPAAVASFAAFAGASGELRASGDALAASAVDAPSSPPPGTAELSPTSLQAETVAAMIATMAPIHREELE